MWNCQVLHSTLNRGQWRWTSTRRGFQEVEDEEELLESEAEEEQQDMGDHQELLPSAGEASDLEGSREVVEQVPHQSEPREPDLALEARRRASLQASLDCISGRGSRPQPLNTRRLGAVGSALLRDWYQPERGVVWSEGKVLGKLRNLRLVPEQQAMLDAGVRLDQWHLGRDQASQPYNGMVRRLITSIVAQRAASVLLLTNADQIAEHRFSMDGIMGDAHSGALLAPGNRDTFNMEDSPQSLAMGDLNPSHTGLVFPGTKLEKPDLSSLLENLSEDVRTRILLAVNENHEGNLLRVQALDQKFRSLYTSAAGLVNDSMETFRGYG